MKKSRFTEAQIVGILKELVEWYTIAFPGSVFFVLPGCAQAIAKSLTNEIANAQLFGQISLSRRRKLVEFLSFYFELGERPLKTERGKEILGTLNGLGIAHTFLTAAEINRTLPEECVDDLTPVLESLIEAETQREKVLAQKLHRKASRSKRKVTMPRIRDALK